MPSLTAFLVTSPTRCESCFSEWADGMMPMMAPTAVKLATITATAAILISGLGLLNTLLWACMFISLCQFLLIEATVSIQRDIYLQSV